MAGDHGHGHGGGGSSGIKAKDVGIVIVVILATIGFFSLVGWPRVHPNDPDPPIPPRAIPERPPHDVVEKAKRIYGDETPTYTIRERNSPDAIGRARDIYGD